MVSGSLARSRKSGVGCPEVVTGRQARSRKCGPGGPEIVNEKSAKEPNGEMGGFR